MEPTYHILVVDDDIYVADVVKAILEDEGFRVTLASNGEKALDIYNKCQTDLIILDIKLPGMDGFKLMEQLRRESEIPTIILTGDHETESLVRMMELGANDYIKKPFRHNELAARVRSNIRRAHLSKN